MNRRQFLALASSAAAVVGGYNRSVAQTSAFTHWGWPQPYQRISDSSTKWLKEKGWWPLAIGNQPAFTGLPVAAGKGFFTARGLEVVVNAFLSGPAINEATV